jgi:TonB family protein
MPAPISVWVAAQRCKTPPLAKRPLLTRLRLFTLCPPDRCGSMEEAILVIALGLLAIAASPSEAKDSPADGVSIVPEIADSPSAAGDDGSGIEPATRATANLVSLFSTDDYPAEAIRNGEQGSVEVSLTVGADGKVADCIVKQSSGSPSLDVQTCRIMWTRAHFTPARDGQGRAVNDTYRQRINWELPEGDPAEMKEDYSRVILAVDAARVIVGCRYESSPPSKITDPQCAKITEFMRQFISGAPDWIPFAGHEVVIETQHRVGDPHDGSELGEQPGEYLLGIARLLLTVDDTGKVKSCSRESWGPTKFTTGSFTCDFAKRWDFEELPEQQSNRNDRQLTVVNAAYLRKPMAQLPTN